MNFVAMLLDNNQQAFFELVKAGLWEKDVQLSRFGNIDYADVYRLADEQSVIGLVTAGFDHVTDVKVPQEDVLQFVGSALQIEQCNNSLNDFVAELIEKLRKEDIYAILVKGQGIAQCYERPLWRTSGDVDLLLSDDNYQKAKELLIPLADDVEKEFKKFKHIGMTLKGDYVVELHGTLHSRLSARIDKAIDDTQNDVFYGGNVRTWQNGKCQVFLPAPDSDIIFIFTHIIHHFYIEGIGLRQICDWCRLLWTYRNKIDVQLLEKRLQTMGLVSEWKAFAALAVDYLGMPVEAMLFYSDEKKWSRKAKKIMEFILEVGNFGHNRQSAGGKINSAWNKMKDFGRHVRVFPIDSIKFFFHFLINGIQLVAEK